MLRTLLSILAIGVAASPSFAGGMAVCLWSPLPKDHPDSINFSYRWCNSSRCLDWTKESLRGSQGKPQTNMLGIEIKSGLSFDIKFDRSFDAGYQEQQYKLDPRYFEALEGNENEICASNAAYKFVRLGNGIDLKKGCPTEAKSCPD